VNDAGGQPALMDWAHAMFGWCRSITGPGLRQTLDFVGEHVEGLERHRVPSGTKCFDWTVPREWSIRDAWIADESGQRVVDFRESNLHVVNYSAPVRERLRWKELADHLHTLPDRPDWIPYRTSYYRETWGFCLRHDLYRELEARGDDARYEVVIDSSLQAGHLDYGELYVPGRRSDEILLSTHVCHPSMANDNLSGIVVLMALARWLQKEKRRYSYRILFAPGTIGAVVWLARNPEARARIRHGLVLAGLGDDGPLTYKRSRRGQAEIDRAVQRVLETREQPHLLLDFSPYGYDERQYGSPGFDLPVGRLSRTRYGTYPEYHTSADDLDFIAEESLQDARQALQGILERLESTETYCNTMPYGEPQLGPRGLYDDFPPGTDVAAARLARLWVLNQSDGAHSLLDIAERSGMDLASVTDAAQALQAAGLLEISGKRKS